LKITPTDKHESIWDAIAEYENHPFESRSPRIDETPTSEELAAISGTLTKEQQAYAQSMIEYQKTMAEELAEANQDTVRPSQDLPGRTVAAETSIDTSYPVNAIQMLARAASELNMSKDDIELALDMSFSDINKTYQQDYWNKLKSYGGNNGKEKKIKSKK
jgi:hypothetical protein